LNDFITPSQVCIKPVEQITGPQEKEAGAPSVRIPSVLFVFVPSLNSSALIDHLGRLK
jgi:hypothetical protein